MAAPRILSVGTANPDLYLSQKDVYEFYEENALLPGGQRELYARLLLDGRIKGRYFGLNSTEEILDEGPDLQIARFAVQGRKILAEACRSAMRKNRLAAGDIGGIVVNTCTGYLCPGLTSYLSEDLGLPSEIKALDIMGMGCGAAIPNLESGCGMLAGTGGKPVICASVEICSATHQIDDDPGLTVSNCIFGDGAAAVLLGGEVHQCETVVLRDFQTGIFPCYREALRYKNHNGHLRNILTRRVPVTGAKCLEDVTRKLLARNGLGVSDINWWAVHAGGTVVLEKVAENFGLAPEKLEASIDVFERYGNMSSPTVIFVLKELLQRGIARGPGLMLAFGAGFSAFAALAYGE